MKTKINFLIRLMIITFIVAGTNAAMASRINVSGIGKISGNIRCIPSNLPLGDVTVTLFSATDSTIIAGTLSDHFGNFSFTMLGTGKYFVEISNTGFTTQTIGQLNIVLGNPKINFGEIQMIPTTSGLKKRKNK